MGRTEKHRTIDKGIVLRTDRLRMTFQNRQFKDEARRNVIIKYIEKPRQMITCKAK